jgi:hypothetical protein
MPITATYATEATATGIMGKGSIILKFTVS